jgi:RNA polymerase sigma-70 factor (ECF subfamily)
MNGDPLMPVRAASDTSVVATHSHPERVPARTRPRASWASVDLIRRASAGDRPAVGQLHGLAWPRLLAFYRYSGLDRHTAEDLASETMERVLGRLTTLREPKAFEAWMWTIARNALRAHRRRARRTVGDHLPPEPLGPSELVELSEDHREIREALALLGDRDRALLWLREVEGLSYTEIGGRLGTATGATRVAVHRARARLRSAFDGIGGV